MCRLKLQISVCREKYTRARLSFTFENLIRKSNNFFKNFCIDFIFSDTVMIFIWSERSGRSRPPSKNVAQQPPLKNSAKHLPPKNATKQLSLKNAAKKAASKYAVNAALLKKCCEAALQKMPCYV